MKQKNKHNFLKTTLIFLAVLTVLSAGYVGFLYANNFFTPAPPAAPSSQKTIDSTAPDASIEDSDETEVVASSINSYTVAPDMPRFLEVQALSMKARIQHMGVNSAGAVQAPVNIYDSGWYKGSTRPGSPDAAFIDGHASGATRQGLFAYLDTLKNDDAVVVEQGDGTRLSYKVVHIEIISKDAVDMNKALAVYGGAQEGLNLMTCTGTWLAREETYDKRVIVYTERVR